MTTVCLQIGNGDDKLSQSQWHEFVVKMHHLVESRCTKLHFFGAPENWHAQQNVAFVFKVEENVIKRLKADIADLRKFFFQESAAWTQGDTEFI